VNHLLSSEYVAVEAVVCVRQYTPQLSFICKYFFPLLENMARTFCYLELWYFVTELDSLEMAAPTRRLVKEVNGVLRDGLQNNTKG
jgi:hypothetical protein